MIQERIEIEGQYTAQITNGATITVNFGSPQLGASIDARRFPFLRFGCFFDKTTTIYLQGSLDNSTFFQFDTCNVPASTYGTIALFAAPLNQFGLYVVTWPFFKFQIKNTDAAITTISRTYVVLQNYRA